MTVYITLCDYYIFNIFLDKYEKIIRTIYVQFFPFKLLQSFKIIYYLSQNRLVSQKYLSTNQEINSLCIL